MKNAMQIIVQVVLMTLVYVAVMVSVTMII